MTSEMNIKPVAVNQNTDVKAAKYNEAELKKLKKACADFESIFTYQLIKTMRQTVPQNKIGMISSGRDNYMAIVDQKLAESISANGNGLGLKKVLFDQLTNSYKPTITKEVANKLK